MASAHAHDSMRPGAGTTRARLAAVLVVTSAVLLAEFVGALLTGSLALLADAGHMLTDVAGVAIALTAASLALRPAAGRRTFGNHRFEVLAATTNAVLLFGVGGYIVVEAVRRLDDPPAVPPVALLLFGLAGLAGNLVSLGILYPVRQGGLNIRAAFLEVLGDALGSAAVVLAAIAIFATGWQQADVVASLAIAALILPRTWRLFRESMDVLLEAAPATWTSMRYAGTSSDCTASSESTTCTPGSSPAGCRRCRHMSSSRQRTRLTVSSSTGSATASGSTSGSSTPRSSWNRPPTATTSTPPTTEVPLSGSAAIGPAPARCPCMRRDRRVTISPPATT
ncbi:MAG: cation diffusion facilitator family transporter [Geodermatophilaceae bacterium]